MKLVTHIGALGAIAGALLASQQASAAEPVVNPDWADHAWYASAGIGVANAAIDRERIERALSANGSSIVSFADDTRDSPAVKVAIGKQLNHYLALEAGYFKLGRFGFDAVTTDGALSGAASFRGVNLDLVGRFPLSERFAVIGRVGAAYAKAKTHFQGNRLNAVTAPYASVSKVGPKLGLGLEYQLSEALALRGEFERYRVNDAAGNRGDIDMATVGLVWKFGRPAAAAPVQIAPPVALAAPAPAPVPPPPPAAPTAPVPTSEKVAFAAEALFDFDKSIVKPDGKAALDALLIKLDGMNTEVLVTVGHTDARGSDGYNQALSQRRAEAVKAYLVSKGVTATRVYTEGKGESQPAAENTTEEGRASNRRVTVEVVGSRPVAR